MFGSLDDPDFEAKHIVSFVLPYPLEYAGQIVTRTRCHRLLTDTFQQVFREIKLAGLDKDFVEYNGIYARRAIRGHPSHASCHSWGIAIDMCASQYPLGSSKRTPETIIEIFSKHGFFYGGDFRSRLDPMHFQYAYLY